MKTLDAILCANNKWFEFNYPEYFDYDIETIAHALSNLCRFGGVYSSFMMLYRIRLVDRNTKFPLH